MKKQNNVTEPLEHRSFDRIAHWRLEHRLSHTDDKFHVAYAYAVTYV
jgi:hypothetical protein